MAGTDSSQNRNEKDAFVRTGPAIILVEPQMGENIGAAARAMLNCELNDLRLVAPRDGWPNWRAEVTASGATEVIEHVLVFDTVEEAVADLHYVVATTARRRDMVKKQWEPRGCADEIRRREVLDERVGILFGPERTGLNNDQIALADAILTAPLNPAFSSLNLGQSVLLVAWEWARARPDLQDAEPETGQRDSRPATRKELVGFFDHFERALDAVGYFKTPEMRPIMVRNLRNLFHRAALTEQEVRSLHGVVAMLVGKRRNELPESAALESPTHE